ncbi:hypothetical protein DRP53_03210 [candidate division WOR-3 bacterium]|uniref:Methylated-DNA-[protein]-cysteine S-methyltransferase DNA binding domain-containing protein n=1 Tax=candidate division WOR-3 bacterium TaxID=2052148 RepID=A0A660SLK2_UNCW3|nr:MAG: hypothetical protein DRP53_03210 [candidate division WOR-3 bacterium]
MVFDFLERYFDREPGSISFPIDCSDLKPYHLMVYHQLTRLPFGKTMTYQDLAVILKTSPRAIGQILKLNPFPIVFPCHRIVSKSGLGGFSAGREWKVGLLRHEGCL